MVPSLSFRQTYQKGICQVDVLGIAVVARWCFAFHKAFLKNVGIDVLHLVLYNRLYYCHYFIWKNRILAGKN